MMRFPGRPSSSALERGPLEHEIVQEMAISLGRAGRKVEVALTRLREGAGDRNVLLAEAADAVHAYFIQRELCGLRRHEGVIRHYDIPRPVLARLGVK